jgi:hypothetical protein
MPAPTRSSRRGGVCARRRAADADGARALHAAVVARAACAAAAAVVARPPRAGLSRAHRRALRPLRATRRAMRATSCGFTRCRSARRAPRRR